MTIPEFVSEKPQDSTPPISALAVFSFIMGLIALLTCWIPVINMFIFAFALVSLGLGIAAIITTKKQNPKRSGSAFAFAGTIISILALLGVVGAQTVYKTNAEHALDQIKASLHLTAGDSKMEEAADNKMEELPEQSADPNGYISIDTLSAPIPDFEGNPAVILSCTVRKRIGNAYLSSHPINARAFQNGKELKRFVLFRYDPEGYDGRSAIEGSPEDTQTVTFPFLLDDETSDVRIEIEAETKNSDTQEFISEIKLTKTFSLQ